MLFLRPCIIFVFTIAFDPLLSTGKDTELLTLFEGREEGNARKPGVIIILGWKPRLFPSSSHLRFSLLSCCFFKTSLCAKTRSPLDLDGGEGDLRGREGLRILNPRDKEVTKCGPASDRNGWGFAIVACYW
ncbi:uncharacterized protein BP01DRAFT_359713, partial [Aspergillus saccharolyticus JOP 1030-1]